MSDTAPQNPHIGPDDVRHVALLSRLEFNDGEVTRFTRELNDILAYVDQLQELNTEGVEPTSHAIKQVNVFRPDTPGISLTNDEALANAPDSESGCFKTPPIIQG